MLNILPIYVVLLALVAYMMMRRSVAGVLAVSVTRIWLAANLIGINLPSEQEHAGR